MKNFHKYIIGFSVPVVFVGVIYLSFLYIAPPVLNSSKMVSNYEKFLSSKFGADVKFQNFSLHTYPNLSFDLSADKIWAVTPDKKEPVVIKNVYYKSKPFSFKPVEITADDIFADIFELRKNMSKNHKKSKFNFDYLPIVNIKKAFVKIDDKGASVSFENIKSEKINKTIVCTFLANIRVPYLKFPVIVGKEGRITYKDEIFYDKLSVEAQSSKLYLQGTQKNLNFTGKDLSAEELKSAFLYYYKFKHPDKKNFIENFHQMSGKLDVNLNRSKDGLTGMCRGKELKALFSNFLIPVYLPATDFKFTGREVSADTKGLFGGEPVHTDFYLKGLATKDVYVTGTVGARLTDKFSSKYFPQVKISGSADAFVKYITHNGRVNIDYSLTVPKGSNLLSKYGNLDNVSETRQIFAKTLKIGDKIQLTEYNYSFLNKNAKKILLLGDGLFEKVKGHYKPSYFSVRTNETVPVAVVRSFLRDFLDDGTFSGNLRYEFKTKTLDGFLNLYDVSHKDYLFLKETNLKIANNKLKLTSEGTFFNSPISLSLLADNNFRNSILIHNIDIHLNRFIVQRGKIASSFPHRISHGSINRDYNVTVEKGQILVDEIYNKKFSLHNVKIFGSLADNKADFIIPQTSYAKGILTAKGWYNIKNHSSDIHFLASDIDSNEVASNIFNFRNQIEGLAFATLHLKTKEKLNDIKAYATFAVTDGYLPKLGSTEFMIGQSKRHKIFKLIKKPFVFSLSKITNIDFSKPNVFYSNLRGSFMLDNDQIQNAKVFSQSDYLSLFIEGDYNIDSEHADLCIWGRHNKTAEKKIRIFKIPLSIIYRLVFRIERTKDLYTDKLAQIPPIKLQPLDIESVFRVSICGNLNNGQVKVKMKDLR